MTYSYRWYRDGTAISGATGKTYTVKTSDRGHTLTVRLTATKRGYASIRKTSSGVPIPG